MTRDQVRQVDRLAIQTLGIPGVVLMENAGRNTAATVLELLRQKHRIEPTAARAVILCGGGNNGGDGYVIARHLHNARVSVVVHPVVDPAQLTGDAAINYTICQKIGLDIVPILNADALAAAARLWPQAHVMVDALLGTGFTGIVRPHLASVIDCCNRISGPTVVAVDVPSGLDCDTGMPSNATIRAHVTVTFVANKVGFTQPEAQRWVGEVVVADIGTPPELIQTVLGRA